MNDLQLAVGCDNISIEDVASLLEQMTKKKELSKYCDTTKIKKKTGKELYYIYIERKQFTAKSKDILIDKLYIHFFGEKSWTLEQAYESWFFWKQETGTNSKTLREYHNEWNGFIKNTQLSQQPVVKISTHDLKSYYLKVTANYAITKKRLININVVLNGIMNYCVDREIITHNLIRDIDMKQYQKRCRSSKSTKVNYTDEERTKLLAYLSEIDEMYAYAIQLDFYATLRIGELLSIRYDDIKNGFVSINRSMRESYTIDSNMNFTLSGVTNDERIKGNEASGFRTLFLTDQAMRIVEKAHNLNPNGEFLFEKYGRQLNPKTFNKYLKKYCEEAGVSYHSSHQIRFTMATNLYKNGVNLTEVSTMLGHADVATTLHYIRQNQASDETNARLAAIMNI